MDAAHSPRNPLTVEVDEPGRRTLLLRVSGDLDTTGARTLDDALAVGLDAPTSNTAPARLVLDLSRVTLLAAAGLNLLLRLRRRARTRDVHVVLVGTAEPAVNRPLRMAGLLGLFDIRPTVDSALAPPLRTRRPVAVAAPGPPVGATPPRTPAPEPGPIPVSSSSRHARP